jgi:GMP synthase (glutamine-hydrolysing)
VQAAEIRADEGVFWGVQYHPELSLAEIAAALRREEDALVQEGLAQSPEALEQHAGLIDELHQEPGRRDLAWCLGLDEQVTESRQRQTELRNFIELAVKPNRSARGRA